MLPARRAVAAPTHQVSRASPFLSFAAGRMPAPFFLVSLSPRSARADLGDKLTKKNGAGIRPAAKLKKGDARLTW